MKPLLILFLFVFQPFHQTQQNPSDGIFLVNPNGELVRKLSGKYTPYKLDKNPLVPLSEFVGANRQKTEFGLDAIAIKLTSSGTQKMTALTRSKTADGLAFVFNDVLIAVLPASQFPTKEEFVLMANLSDSQIDSIVDLINEK